MSTNLEFFQSNLTYMHAKHGTGYHWIPEIYRLMNLPVFDGVEEALERHTVNRKKNECRAKTTPVKKRRIELKQKRVEEESQRLEWSQNLGQNTHGVNRDADSDDERQRKSVFLVAQLHTNALATEIAHIIRASVA